MRRLTTLSLLAGMLFSLSSQAKTDSSTMPEGSTLKSMTEAKTIELFYFDEFYKQGRLSEIEIAAWKNLCVDAKADYTKRLTVDFSLDNLEVEKDVRVISKLNQTILQPGNERSMEAYYGCRLFLQTDAVGYTVVKKEFQFLNAENCERPVDATKRWRKENKNEVHIGKEIMKISRRIRACVVTVVGVEAY
jgi:hypothetical protein